jgi:Cu/Ag efflux protein CusF
MRKLLTAVLLAAGLALAAGASADAKEKQAIVGTQVETKATVESIDQDTRHVLLRNEDGSLQTIVVGPEVRNLAQVKAGDRVLFRFRLGVVAQLAPTDGSGPEVAQADVTGKAPQGQLPAGLVGQALRVRVTFNSYDHKTKKVSYTLPGGASESLVLHTKTMQDFAAGLKAGDKVNVTFLRSVAVAVMPAA